MLILLIILTFIILCLGFFSLSSTPHIDQNHQIDTSSAANATNAMKVVYQSLRSSRQNKVLQISDKELKGISAIAHRAKKNINSDIHLSTSGLQIDASIELPLPKIIRYLNVRSIILPSDQGINLSDVTIGQITLSGTLLLNILEWGANYFIQESLGTQIVEMVTSVSMNNNYLKVKYQLPEQFNNINAENRHGLFALRDELALFGDTEHIKWYYDHLVNYAQTADNKSKLSSFVSYIFSLAKSKSMLEPTVANSTVSENKAALMALVLYFGSDKFELLVGDISSLSKKEMLKRNRLKSSVTLNSRVDLQKHFIYSIALQLFSTSDASNAVGELKEFLDSNQGGSGFSFADLMADRAGNRLAVIATQSEHSAFKTQLILSDKSTEHNLMPNILHLPEGLDQQSFEAIYKNVKTTEYIEMLADIDTRLTTIDIYNLE